MANIASPRLETTIIPTVGLTMGLGMFEDMIGKKIVIVLKGNSKSVFGKLIFEDEEAVKLEFDGGAIYTFNKDDISYGRLFKEESGNFG